MARPGRKRKDRLSEAEPGARVDRGTPELQMYRALLARDGDPALTESPIGVLLARETITQAQHQAGEQYAWLRSKRFGVSPHARAASMDEVRGGQDNHDDSQAAIRKRWEAAERALRDAGSKARSEVESLAVYRRWPSWWLRSLRGIYRRTDSRGRDALAIGLQALADHFGYRTEQGEAA